MSDRAEYIKGLREMANLLEANPEARLPYYGNDQPVPVYLSTIYGQDPLAGALAYIAAMNERPTLTFDDLEGKPNHWLKVDGRIRGVHVWMRLRVREVCKLVDGEPVVPPALLAAPTGQPAPTTAGPDRVLAALAAALSTLNDVRHERVIMTAAVLAHRHELTPQEAAEMAANDCSGETTRSAWAEATRLLDGAALAVAGG
ncbi:hypothetical protein OG884_15745 [Streptosporangium sp. NBC_01755]|uniref:hypothetical protein n=1 Tax=Streptosporangium sp. NBC_01755 TaxID=2975949 RepID=UPI002DD96AA9|nr:hypothetical protein [Streptosporangium sp. NBC_01755]WSD03287.1 hypothetical protein OG884_15745 [Streptosporangium sp. NBC_01755]